MIKLRWSVIVPALAIVLVVGGGVAWWMWIMPPRMAIPKPIALDSELSHVMLEARRNSLAEAHDQAAALYTRGLAIEPGPNVISQDLLALRGSEYNYLDMPEKAFADYDAAIRIGYYGKPLSSAAIRAYMGRGYAALNLAQYARAKDDFDLVLKDLPADVPRSSSTLAWRGAAFQGLGDRTRAVADYKAALVLDPKNARAREALRDLGEP